jgi:uncharacterized protein YeaO (DUF488 family)
MAGRAAEFADRYPAELDGPGQQAALKQVRARAKAGPVTLVTSAKDVEHSHLPVLVRKIRV